MFLMRLHRSWIQVSSTGMTSSFFGFQTGMTAVLRHTAAVFPDPANT
ncbi:MULTISPECIES: hypothetical protein [unclassified Wolbachia]|nr:MULTISPECIES: hypothetical protein [unclassified Wolbachia]